MELLVTKKENKYTRSYLSPGKCRNYLIWKTSQKIWFHCKYSGILKITMDNKVPLPKSMYNCQCAVMLPEGEMRRQVMARPSTVLFASPLLGMHKWQLSTPGNYRLLLCLLLPFPSSCSTQPALLFPAACLTRNKNIPQMCHQHCCSQRGQQMQELMGSFISSLTLWQGQAAKDMLALSLLEIIHTYTANQF